MLAPLVLLANCYSAESHAESDIPLPSELHPLLAACSAASLIVESKKGDDGTDLIVQSVVSRGSWSNLTSRRTQSHQYTPVFNKKRLG